MATRGQLRGPMIPLCLLRRSIAARNSARRRLSHVSCLGIGNVAVATTVTGKLGGRLKGTAIAPKSGRLTIKEY